MPEYANKDVRGGTGYPTYGFDTPAQTGATTGRGGMAQDSSGNPLLLNTAGTVILDTGDSTGIAMGYEASFTGTSASTGVFKSAVNPWGYDVWIVARFIRVTTQSTGASTVDLGVAVDAVTSNDGLIDGISLASTGYKTTAGTNGNTCILWPAGYYLNLAEASGDVDGVVGKIVVTCQRAA